MDNATLPHATISESSNCIQQGDLVILVIGCCGSGRSTLACYLSGLDPAASGLVGSSGSLQPCTLDVRYIRFRDPSRRHRPIVLIDTPGYDDGDEDTVGAALRISRCLKERSFNVDAVVYVQRVRDHNNVTRYLGLSGVLNLQRVPFLFLTTHWGFAHRDKELEDEQQLKSKWLGPLKKSFKVLPFSRWDDEGDDGLGGRVSPEERANGIMTSILGAIDLHASDSSNRSGLQWVFDLLCCW